MREPELAPSGRLAVEVTTERLRLEPLRVAHAARMFAGLRDPELYRYETDEPPASLGALEARYAELTTAPGGMRGPGPNEDWLNWIVVVRATGDAIGYVQATTDRARRSAMIGYLTAAAFQRQGYGAEAVGAICDHLEACGVTRLSATIDVRNAASIALVERLGFERKSTYRSDDVIGGVRGYDHCYVRTSREVRWPGEAEP